MSIHLKIHYETNCGQYIMFRNSVPVTAVMDEVALAYSFDPQDRLYTRHKHGSPKHVRSWAAAAQAKLSGVIGSDTDTAWQIKIIQGAFPVDLLNEAIDGNTSALEHLIGMATAIDVEAREVDADSETTMAAPLELRVLRPAG